MGKCSVNNYEIVAPFILAEGWNLQKTVVWAASGCHLFDDMPHDGEAKSVGLSLTVWGRCTVDLLVSARPWKGIWGWSCLGEGWRCWLGMQLATRDDTEGGCGVKGWTRLAKSAVQLVVTNLMVVEGGLLINSCLPNMKVETEMQVAGRTCSWRVRLEVCARICRWRNEIQLYITSCRWRPSTRICTWIKLQVAG